MSARMWCVATTVALSLMFGGGSAFATNEVLKDGTKIEIDDGGKVFAVCPCSRDAAIIRGYVENWKTKGRVQAKDGTYTLENGKTIQVKGGRLVNAEEKAHKPLTR